ERKQEYAGKVIKCPHCGAELPSMAGFCPSCGSEIRGTQVTESVKEFTEIITEYENVIAYNPRGERRGWARWGFWMRAFWIFLNLILFLLPLGLYFVWFFFRDNFHPALTPEERQEVQYVQNYVFPNDRESIFEAMLFIKSKVAFLRNEKTNARTVYWSKIWLEKANQLSQKDELLFKNDSTARQTYDDIIANQSQIKKKSWFKGAVGIVIVILSIIFLASCSASSGSSSSSSNYTDETDYYVQLDLPSSGIVTMLPELDFEYGKVTFETSEDIQIEIYQVSQDDFDSYVKFCRESGFDVDITKDDDIFYSENAEGYALDIFFDNETSVMEIYFDSYDVGNTKKQK
ncbi:MAG: zinc ribbon domain-containing protein, partial [Clostridiales bacterium]|nr:zinc ribbon domain-containing protein [Clostridiales bacterium]